MLSRNWDVILCRRPVEDGPSSQFYRRCHNFDRNSIRDMCWIRSVIFLRALCSSPVKPAGYICPIRKTASPMFCQLRTSTSRRETICCQIAGSSPSCPRKTIFRNTIDLCRYLWYLRQIEEDFSSVFTSRGKITPSKIHLSGLIFRRVYSKNVKT